MNFWGCFVYNMAIHILDSNPIHRYNGFLLTRFLRRVKATNKTTTLLTRFTYNLTLYWLKNLAMGTNFSSAKCFSCGRFHTNKHVCLDMHCFCLFDNWLCDLIPENWWLTLDISMVMQTVMVKFCDYTHSYFYY